MAVIICGTQRSGTSLTASFLKAYGFDVGSDLWHSDINGGLEHLVACTAFRDIIGDSAFPFRGFPYAEHGNLAGAREKVIKFSFLLMNPAFVYMWHKIRGNSDALLILKRPPVDVVRSKLRGRERFGGEDIGDSLLLDQTPQQLQGNFMSSLAAVQSLEFLHKVIEFPAFAEDFSILLYALAELGLSLDPGKAERVWGDLFDDSKIHFRS